MPITLDDMTSTPKKARYSPVEETQTYAARLEPENYNVLATAASVTGMSINTLLNNAVANYKSSGALQLDVSKRFQETIAKLSGEEPS